MPTAAADIDVLIVGAGPVGLFLANECARRSLRWRVVEQRAGQSEHSKALAIFPRALEVFDMAGLVAPFLAAANRVVSIAVVAHDRRLAQFAVTPATSPYSFIAMVPQDITEALLVQALRRRGGAVEYETSFVSATQRDEAVDVTLEHLGEPRSIRAAFVVGCDGAHSTVRHVLGLPFEGAEYHATFMLADAETNEALRGDEMQLCPHEDGPLAVFPMSSTRRRLVATVEHTDGDAPTLPLMRAILDRRAPKGLEVRSINWSSYFRIHHRQVRHMQAGRIFVAGDAAHIHSPFGGQGMNTGLHDVWNLVWKLDLAIHQRARQELLDSYTAERRPVIRRVIEITDVMTRALGAPSRFAQGMRDIAIPVASRLAPFQRGMVQALSGLGIAYHGSPIVEGPGERYFDESLRGEASAAGFCSSPAPTIGHRRLRESGSWPTTFGMSSSYALGRAGASRSFVPTGTRPTSRAATRRRPRSIAPARSWNDKSSIRTARRDPSMTTSGRRCDPARNLQTCESWRTVTWAQAVLRICWSRPS